MRIWLLRIIPTSFILKIEEDIAMKTVKIGIIGTGGVANGRHIAELLKCENAKIVALCDIAESLV